MATTEMDYMDIGLLDFNNPNMKLPSSIVQIPTLPTGYTNYNNPDNNRKGTYYYKVGTKVFVSLGTTNSNTSAVISNVTLFTLPVGYRPYNKVWGVIGGSNFNTFTNATVTINTDGTVVIYSENYGVFGHIEFDAFN